MRTHIPFTYGDKGSAGSTPAIANNFYITMEEQLWNKQNTVSIIAAKDYAYWSI